MRKLLRAKNPPSSPRRAMARERARWQCSQFRTGTGPDHAAARRSRSAAADSRKTAARRSRSAAAGSRKTAARRSRSTAAGSRKTAARRSRSAAAGSRKTVRTVGILLGWKIGFEDRFKHQPCCCHADPIAQGRDAQRPEFAIGFRYKHSSDGVRSVSLLPERMRQFTQPPLHPIRFDVRKLLTIHSRCALVGAALGVCMNQDVVAADLVVQGVETIAGFCLRFRVQRRLQFLNTLRS